MTEPPSQGEPAPGLTPAAEEELHLAPAAAPPKSKLRVAIQLVGFLIGLALLVWVVNTALSQMTEENWADLRGASVLQVAGLVGLSIFSVAINGIMWWLAIRPVQRVPIFDTISVNAIGTLLAYLPFKLSVLFRVTYHRTFDRVPILRFGGWAAAFSAVLLAGLGPAVALRLVWGYTPFEDNTAIWLIASIIGAIGAALLGSAICRSLATGAGWRWLRRTMFLVLRRRGLRLVKGDLFTNLHTGTHMLAKPGHVLAGAGLRLIDGLGIGLRFLIAATILGVELNAGQALVVGVCFFVIGALAPTGTMGVREGGTAGVFALMGLTEAVAPVVIFVAATQVLGELAIAATAVAWLGPRKLGRLMKSPDNTQPAPPAEQTVPAA